MKPQRSLLICTLVLFSAITFLPVSKSEIYKTRNEIGTHSKKTLSRNSHISHEQRRHKNRPSFDVFWNVPSEECKLFNISIDVTKYGIIQNSEDHFHGDKINILYSPGLFPVLRTKTGHQQNGGIPQRGNLTEHIIVFKNQIEKYVPEEFNGIVVLDFEYYYPVYDMNNEEYKQESRNWIKESYPDVAPEDVEKWARRTFDDYSRKYFEVLLHVGDDLRPDAKWGYYHYPYCHNYKPSHPVCNQKVVEYNDDIMWLFRSSSALFPSIYVQRNHGWTTHSRRLSCKMRIQEAMRISSKSEQPRHIFPYFYFKYIDSKDTFLTSVDLLATLGETKSLKVPGAVIWGSTADVNSYDKCTQLQDFLEKRLGPVVKTLRSIKSLRYLRRHLHSRRRLQELFNKEPLTNHS